MSKIIPYGHQSIDRQDVRAVCEVLRSDFITQGPAVERFEQALCTYTGAKYAVAVSSGTAALHIACLAAGLRPWDELITSAITFAASANCALYCGARPVFVDINRDTLNINAKQIERAITPKTKIIIPVHFGGMPADMASIRSIARKNGLCVIEDAAHAIGAGYRNTMIGKCAYSDMTIFSFHPVKTITTGEGGAVLTNDKRLCERLKIFRSHGITKDNLKNSDHGGWYYEMQELGFNYRMCDIQAALGISQLKKIGRFIKRRREIANIYDKAFEGVPFFSVPGHVSKCDSAYHLYPLRLIGNLRRKRKAVFEALRCAGLGVQVHYIPVYAHPYYRALGFKSGQCPEAEDYYSRAISIPIYPALTDAQVRRVIRIVLDVCARMFRDE